MGSTWNSNRFFLSLAVVLAAAWAGFGNSSTRANEADPSAEDTGYFGEMDDVSIRLKLDWDSNGLVSGAMEVQYPVDETFEIRGNNVREGVFRADLYRNGDRAGTLEVTKRLSDTRVIWEGQSELDGQRYESCNFARVRVTDLPRNPEEVSEYPIETVYVSTDQNPKGLILRWEKDGSVSGTSSVSEGLEKLNTIRGTNPSPGVLEFEEYFENRLLASYSLTKEVSEETISWRGTKREKMFKGTKDTPIVFERSRNVEMAIQEIDPSVAGGKLRILMSPRKQVWTEFAESAKVNDRVPSSFPESTFENATLKSYDSEHGQTSLKLVRWLRLDTSHAIPWGPEIEIVIGRDLPFEKQDMEGRTILGWFERTGRVKELELDAFLITHWRIGSDGKMRVGGILDSKMDYSSEKPGDLFESKDWIEVLPDKVSTWVDRGQNGMEDPFVPVREFRVSEQYGVVINVRYAGPGMIELEALDLDESLESEQWTPVLLDDGFEKIPPAQKIKDAG